MPRDQIGQFLWRLGFGNRGQRIFGDVFLDLGIALKLVCDRPQQGRCCRLIAQFFFKRRGLCLKKLVRFGEFLDFDAGFSFDQYFDCAIGQFQQLQNRGQDTHRINSFRFRVINGGVNLTGQQDLSIILHHLFQRAHRFFAPHKERHNHMGKHDNVAQRQNWIGFVNFWHHAFLFFVARERAIPSLAIIWLSPHGAATFGQP